MYGNYVKLFLLFRILASVHGILFSSKNVKSKNDEVFFKSNQGVNHREMLSFTPSIFRQLTPDGNDIQIYTRTVFAISWPEKNVSFFSDLSSQYLKNECAFDYSKIWSHPSVVRFQHRYIRKERRLAVSGPTRKLSRRDRRLRLASTTRNTNELSDIERRNSKVSREINFRLDSQVRRMGVAKLRQNRRNIKTEYTEIISKDGTEGVFRDNPMNCIRMQDRLGRTRRLQNSQMREVRRIISKMNPSRRVLSEKSNVAAAERGVRRKNSKSFQRSRSMELKSAAADESNAFASRIRNTDSSHSLANRQRITRTTGDLVKAKGHALSPRQNIRTEIAILHAFSSSKRLENVRFRIASEIRDASRGSNKKCSSLEKYGIRRIRSSPTTRSISLLEARNKMSKYERFDQRSRLHAERIQLRQDFRIDERIVTSSPKLRQNIRREEIHSSNGRSQALRMNERKVTRRYEVASVDNRRANLKGDKKTARDWWWGKSMPKSLDIIVVSLLFFCEFHAVVKETNTKKMANVGSAIGFLFRATKA